MDVYTQLVQDVYIPRMVRCEQTFENPTIEQKDKSDRSHVVL